MVLQRQSSNTTVTVCFQASAEAAKKNLTTRLLATTGSCLNDYGKILSSLQEVQQIGFHQALQRSISASAQSTVSRQLVRIRIDHFG